jgi:Tfp pilus assembly protein PilN
VIRFNFLPTPLTEAFERLRAIQLDRPTLRSLCVFGFCTAIVCAAVAVERVRVVGAERDADVAGARLLAAERDVSTERDAIARVAQLGAAAHQVRAARDSGRWYAARLAEISSRLPRRAWLDSLHDEDGSVQISGQTDDYRTLASALRGFARYSTVSHATLMDARTIEAADSASTVRYHMSLVDRAR